MAEGRRKENVCMCVSGSGRKRVCGEQVMVVMVALRELVGS